MRNQNREIGIFLRNFFIFWEIKFDTWIGGFFNQKDVKNLSRSATGLDNIYDYLNAWIASRTTTIISRDVNNIKPIEFTTDFANMQF